MSQKQVLMQVLSQGVQLTSKQIRARFGIASPTKVISRIRMQEGIAIKSRKTIDTKGRIKHKFYVGTPTRDIIAAGYRARALGI